MIYNVNDKLPAGKLLLFSFQMVLSVFVASVLIAQICGVAVSGALVGAGLATIAYALITKFQSPMFCSNSGALVAPVILALSVAGYTGVAVGGLVTCAVYTIFGLIFSKISVEKVYRIFPQSLIGSITCVIGISLMGFLTTYVQIDGETNMYGVSVALVTLVAVAGVSHYTKGMMKMLAFLVGTFIGYLYAIILTYVFHTPIVNFNAFSNLHLFAMPDFAFTHFGSGCSLGSLIPVCLIFLAYTVSAMMEALSDHAALGGIIGKDLYQEPGLKRIFIGEGVANVVGTCVGGLGICSYGESVGTIGISRVAAVRVTIGAALMLAALGFIEPVQALIASIPSCVFCGCAIMLYGFIACSGVKMLQQVDLNNQKNLIIVSVVLSIGVSGIAVGGANFALSGTALALLVGIILNFALSKKEETNGQTATD